MSLRPIARRVGSRSCQARAQRGAGGSCSRALFAALGAFGVGASAALADPVVIPGVPLTIDLDELAQYQSVYSAPGGNCFPGDASTGDCGFPLVLPCAAGGPGSVAPRASPTIAVQLPGS